MATSRTRQVYTHQQRAEYLAQFARSGLSQTEFCRRAQIHIATFSLWRRAVRAATSPAFAEVRLSAPSASGIATLHLPSGAKLEVTLGPDAMWLGLGLLLKRLQS
jgi:transposase-like protein